ncbi:alpha/beta hydrolase [Streptomyces asiaticus]
MPYTWSVSPEVIFPARYRQMVNFGLPARDVDEVRSAVTDMWLDGPGGWVHEWSKLGARYADDGNPTLAALAYGYAKFPVLADDARRTALRHQIEQYLLAASSFPVDFERRVLDIPYQGSTTRVAVHIFSTPGLPLDAPVILASGGADGHKIDVHHMFMSFAQGTKARVVAFDIPGTGESEIAMIPESREVIDGLVSFCRSLGNGRVVHFGLSMGGYFSAYSGLSGLVDAAVNCGGPVEAAFAPGRTWAEGAVGIIGNLFGFDQEPTPEEMQRQVGPHSLRPLLDRDDNCKMLVINGTADALVPVEDSLVFSGRRDTLVVISEGETHCVVTKWDDTIALITGWLAQEVA